MKRNIFFCFHCICPACFSLSFLHYFSRTNVGHVFFFCTYYIDNRNWHIRHVEYLLQKPEGSKPQLMHVRTHAMWAYLRSLLSEQIWTAKCSLQTHWSCLASLFPFFGLNVEKEKTNASPIEILYFKAGLKIKQSSCKNWDLTWLSHEMLIID